MGGARLIILFVALVAAGGAAFLVQQLVSQDAPSAPTVVQAEAINNVSVLVASKDIQPGHKLGASDLRWQAWPEDAISSRFIMGGSDKEAAMENVVGSIARAQFFTGEPVQSAKLVRADGAGFLAAILPEGMRAMSVKISAETGAGGFILPNDRVDVILTGEDDNGDGGDSAYHSRIILNNIRVLAIDQTFEQVEGNQVVVGKTATLEVRPAQAETLALAEQAGEVSLALRSIADSAPNANDNIKRTSNGSVTVVRYGRPSRATIDAVN